VKTEISKQVDPTGIGFAFGGVYPGHLHSKGRLHEKHVVSYSVGRVGRYLLHVRLRQQALPLPGSPFALTVSPGAADARSTHLVCDDMPLRGTVGLADSEGCRLVLATSDVMGNVCTSGGAPVEVACDSEKVESQCTDQNDGTYLLQWRSKSSGTFMVKVCIDKTQVQGSPMKVKLTSTSPDLSKCELGGHGLKHAVAGQPSSIWIRFVDVFGNRASPGSEFKVGLGMAHDRKKLQDIKPHEYEGKWGAEDSGEFNVTWIATVAGNTELHVWADPLSNNERIPLPGSPFTLHVGPGGPKSSTSHVDGWTKESRSQDVKESRAKAHRQSISGEAMAEAEAKVIAGDLMSLRPLIVDAFGNPTQLKEGSSALKATLVKPDGTELPLSVLTAYAKTSSLANYEVKCDSQVAGEHGVNIRLNNEPIKGSPVVFEVHCSSPDPENTQLIPPENSDNLVADYERPSVVILKTFDKFGNPCKTGGLVPTGRLSLIKQNAADQTLLMPNNHIVTVEDQHDGTYAISIAIKVTATVKLMINQDKNLPTGGGELPPLQLSFWAEKSEVEEEKPSAETTSPQPQKADRRASFREERRSSIGSTRGSSLMHTAAAAEAAAAHNDAVHAHSLT
jgi:hypothetical protein